MTSADRENHDMTQTDIALLLAEAADEVEIGTAPVQAVVRRGRRRRARRWAVSAATALVLAGSTGATLALTGLPGHTDRPSTVAAEPSTPGTRHVYEPQLTELAHGTDRGTDWRVVLSVWGAPRDEAEAAGQLAAMRKYGIEAHALPDGRHLVGGTSYYAGLYYGGSYRTVMFNTLQKWEPQSGTDMGSAALPLAKGNDDGPDRLVVGEVAATAQQVKCTWDEGVSTVELPRAAAGSPSHWFVCVAPKGRHYAHAEVIQ